jgi:23S rRNA pseudouridine1911/1915/1917 synthase
MSRRKKLEVLYEDNHLIAVNKPVGMLVHGDSTGDFTLADEVKAYIKKKYKKPGDVFLGVIHRIDRPVSGVVVFARTSKALARMNEKIKERAIQKKYKAIVWERPDELEGQLVHYILKDRTRNTVKALKKEKQGSKKAIMNYRFEAEVSHYIKLDIDLKTGRPHQIRAQLAAIGSPIVGDRKYGYHKFNEDKSVCLHCREMSFEHPVKKERMSIKAPLPKTPIWSLFN